MQVRCKNCDTAWEIKKAPVNGHLKCPGCGDLIRPVAGQASTSSPRPKSPKQLRKKPRLPRRSRRRRRKPGRFTSAVVLILFLAASAGTGWYLYRQSRAPVDGGRALGLLPDSTVAVASIEQFDRLRPDLVRLQEADRSHVEDALEFYRDRTVRWLYDTLDLAPPDADRAVNNIVHVGVGLVPVDTEPAAPVILLTLSSRAATATFVSETAVGPRRLGRKGRLYSVVFEQVVALCRRREPLEQMANSFAEDGAGSLAQSEWFRAAHAEYSEKGRVWFYATSEAVPAIAQAARARRAAALVPSWQHAAGRIELGRSSVLLHARVSIGGGREYYTQVRLAPRELRALEYAPADAGGALALSLGEPMQTYRRALAALSERAGETGINPRVMARQFEHDHEGIYLERDVISELAGEIGLILPASGEPTGGALLLAVNSSRRAEEKLRYLSEKILGAEPRTTVRDGRPVLVLPTPEPIHCAFVDDMLVMSLRAQSVVDVRAARRSGETLAADERFATLTGALPARLTGLLYLREPEAARSARRGSAPWTAALGFAMEEARIVLAAALPTPGQAILAHSTPLRRRPVVDIAADDPPPGEEARPSRVPDHDPDHLEQLVRLCREFLEENNRYPRSLAELIEEGYLAEDRLDWLVQPGDTNPRGRVGDQHPTSYRAAFRIAQPRAFGPETPGELPMIWQIVSDRAGQRLIARFDGEIELRRTERGELAGVLRSAIEQMRQRGEMINDEPEAEPEEAEPEEEGEPEEAEEFEWPEDDDRFPDGD